MDKSKKRIGIVALILIIVSLFVIFFYPSNTADPAGEAQTSDPIITVTPEK